MWSYKEKDVIKFSWKDKDIDTKSFHIDFHSIIDFCVLHDRIRIEINKPEFRINRKGDDLAKWRVYIGYIYIIKKKEKKNWR
jgi:hypothetical protein